MKKYLTVWGILFALIGFEYYALNLNPHLSMISHLQKHGLIRDKFEVSPAPGRSMSLWLGWAGLGLMIIMNLYSMRKRFQFLQGLGKLSDWLNFHVFCGLLGPTFILFHCNFKVRGIVGISFWSMVISFSSGVIGRYFYMQMLREKSFFENESIKMEERLIKFLTKNEVVFNEKEVQMYKQKVLQLVGLPNGDNDVLNPFSAFLFAVIGDIKLNFKKPQRAPAWPEQTEAILVEYAINKRKALFLVPFQQLMGYWHTFHFPFAIFMYVVAVIHVAAALVLGV